MNRIARSAFVVIAIWSVGRMGFGATQQAGGAAASKALQVTVDEKGFHPPSLTLKVNVPARIAFLRTTDSPCATSVLIKDYNVKQDLPLNKPVVIDLTPKKTGEIKFTCGMNMLKGKLIVGEK